MPDIIADFHGTLYQDTNEGPLWQYVAKQAVSPLWLALITHPARTVAFARAKGRLEELSERYRRGEIGYDKIYGEYNRSILSRLSLDFVMRAIETYSRLPETRQKLDMRVLDPVIESSGRKGVLSTGSARFISSVLRYFPEGSFYVVANPVKEKGNGTEFRLGVYGNKPEILGSMFFRRGFDPKRTVYLGDNEDEVPAFEYVLDYGGKVVVPFYATDAFKQHAAANYKAVVPETKQALSRFLQSLKA